MHFIGVNWDNTSEQPLMNVTGKKSQFSLRDPLTIMVGDKRTCIGSYSHPNYQKSICPYSQEVTDKAQCDLCNRADSKYFLSLNALGEEQLKILEQQAHSNYIDVFGDNHIKTGVAANVRKNTRLLEQGATAGIFFAESDGVTARKIEQAVSKALTIVQSVSWQTKIKMIKIDINQDQATEILRKVYIDICRAIPAEYKKYLKSEPEYTFKLNQYKKRIPTNLTSIIYVNKIRPRDVISGEIIGILGELILIKSTDITQQVYAVSSRALGGYHIEIENKIDNNVLPHDLKTIQLQEQKSDQLTLF